MNTLKLLFLILYLIREYYNDDGFGIIVGRSRLQGDCNHLRSRRIEEWQSNWCSGRQLMALTVDQILSRWAQGTTLAISRVRVEAIGTLNATLKSKVHVDAVLRIWNVSFYEPEPQSTGTQKPL